MLCNQGRLMENEGEIKMLKVPISEDSFIHIFIQQILIAYIHCARDPIHLNLHEQKMCLKKMAD